MKRPLPIWPDDALAAMREMSLAGRAAWIMLQLAVWRRDPCTLPDDDRKLARTVALAPATWRKVKGEVMAAGWSLGPDGWRHAHIEKEKAYAEGKSGSAKASADRRWNAARDSANNSPITARKNSPADGRKPLKRNRQGDAVALRTVYERNATLPPSIDNLVDSPSSPARYGGALLPTAAFYTESGLSPEQAERAAQEVASEMNKAAAA